MISLAMLANTYLNLSDDEYREFIEIYNSMCILKVPDTKRYYIKYGESWCAMFTSVIAHKAGLDADKFPYGVSVREQYLTAVKRGKFYTERKNIKVGDLVIFSWNLRDLQHVGIVTGVDLENITTVEGNLSGTSGTRTISKYDKRVYGFIEV